MKADVPALAFEPPAFSVIARLRWRELANRITQMTQESPIKLTATLVFILLIWVSLFLFFHGVFDRVYQTSLEGVVAIPMVFKFFFIALMVMLTFSNAILAHGSLFNRQESAYLFASPVRPAHIVALKFLEGLVLSSWSLILLGIPLMLAMASRSESWVFYPYFVGFFLCFVPIPAAIGLFAAWAVGMWFPSGGRRLLIAVAVLIAALSITWLWRAWDATTASQTNWIKSFYAQMSLVESALWPSTWVSHGIHAAANRQPGVAAFYLYLTLANALFLSYVVVWFVGTNALKAYSRAQTGDDASAVRSRWIAAGLTRVLFFYLPQRLRLVAMKDLQAFLRDPLQWSQLAILFGLMAIYIVNIPRLGGLDGFLANRMLVAYLNFSAICLILATFTSRFIYPMISLEGHQLWLIGLLPMRRRGLVMAKFAFALTITALCAMAVMLLSASMLQLPLRWTAAQLVVMGSVCCGLSGLAVGIGARFPLFEQQNPTRIASGFGGTINLIVSVAFVIAVLVAVGMVSLRFQRQGGPMLDIRGFLVYAAIVLFGIAAGAVPLIIGARHFERAEV